MITNFAELCTAAYVLVDDLYRLLVAPHDHRPGPRSRCSESEIITMTLVAEVVGLEEERAFLSYLQRNHPTLFPHLPERTRYNRRRRRLTAVTNRIRRGLALMVALRLTEEEHALCVIDSLPIAVVGFAHARGAHRWYGYAAYGYNAAKSQIYYGFKLHLLCTHSGLPLDFALTPANCTDGTVTEQLLFDKADLLVLGDKAYINGPLQALLVQRNNIHLLTPARANQHGQHDPLRDRLQAHFRQAIETINSQLTEQFHIERNRAKCLAGLCARVQAKLAAYTLGLCLNALLCQPLHALKPLALI
jgi:hypothetical protein